MGRVREILVPDRYIPDIRCGRRKSIIRYGVTPCDITDELWLRGNHSGDCVKVILIGLRLTDFYNLTANEIINEGFSRGDELVESLKIDDPTILWGGTATVHTFKLKK